MDKLELARTIILQTAPQFASDPSILLPAADDNDEKREALELLYYAAAFLLSRGIINVEDDTTDSDFNGTNSEIISEQPTLH
jgi:hypothetical protein